MEIKNFTLKRKMDALNRLYGFDDRFKVEKKQCTQHRRFSAISGHHSSTRTMKFSMKVVNYIIKQNLKHDAENMVVSPVSMDIMLNIIALGSKGATLKQLLDLIGCKDVEEFNKLVSILSDVLQQSKEDDDGPEISVANGLWVDQSYQLKKQFQQIVRDLHKAEVMSVDFVNKLDEVVKEANLWVEKQSKGLINEILSTDSLNNDTMMVLTNALYFKGTWVERFRHENTKDQDFYLLNGKRVQVPFMNMRYTKFDYGNFEGCQVLRMLYNEGEFLKGENKTSFSMYIVLPEKKDGLPDFFSKIQKDSAMFLDNIKLYNERIDYLAIPKFKFDCNLLLKETMMDLGLTLPFDGSSEGITEMVNLSLYVSKIFQKSHVDVDEEGTRAVTFTVAKMAPGCVLPPPRPPTNFVADHPFMFMIREDYTGAILFLGTVLHP